MRAEFLTFGQLVVEGAIYSHDVLIDGGTVRKREHGPSKAHRDLYGHTPLSADEAIPWSPGEWLIVGTGALGCLPIMEEVFVEAERRGVDIVAVKTEAACRLLAALPDEDVHAILHVAC